MDDYYKEQFQIEYSKYQDTYLEDINEKINSIKTQINRQNLDNDLVNDLMDVIDDLEREVQLNRIKREKEIQDQINKNIIPFRDIDEGTPIEDTMYLMMKNKYLYYCKYANDSRKPYKIFFCILDWSIKVYSAGLYSLISIAIKLLSS